MKLLTDVGVGKIVETWLIENGYDLKAVRDINPRMTDQDILKLAAQEQRVVITMDKDFGELVYRARQPHAGVLLLRLETAGGEEKRQVIEQIMTHHANEIDGKFSVYQNGRLRIRA
jgi:predicted nuclease of predicted toxin-antitoxin system